MNERTENSNRRTRSPVRGLFSALLVISFGAALLCASTSLADVGDQYLPQVPNAGGKMDRQETDPVSTDIQTPTTASSPGDGKKGSDDSEQEDQVAAVFPSQGGGPGTGSVIALSVLAMALAASVLWLVARGRQTPADSEPLDLPSNRPDTPAGEITGDRSSGSEQ